MVLIKSFRRRIAGLLGLVILLGLLTACGDATPDRATTPALSLTNTPTITVTTNVSISSISSDAASSAKQQIISAPVTPGPTAPLALVGTASLPTNGSAPTIPSTPNETLLVISPTSIVSPAISLPVASSNSGLLKGHVVSEPGCPVARAGNPCPPLALANRTVKITQQADPGFLKTVITDNNGYFSIELASGSYQVEVTPSTNSIERRKPYLVMVVTDQTKNLEIVVDSGIR